MQEAATSSVRGLRSEGFDRRRLRLAAACALAIASWAMLSGAAAQAATPLPSYSAVALDSPTPQANGRFGWAMNTVGDLDGDGVNDVAVGSIGQNVGPFSRAGRAWVFSGRTRKVLLTLNSPEARSDVFGNFGSSVLGLGDVDGDGVPDVVVGAFRQAVYTGGGTGCGTPEPNGCNENQGKVYAFSGRTGALLYTVDNPTPQAGAVFGDRYATATSDLNGDGVRDFVETASFETVGTCTYDFDFDPNTPPTTEPCPVGAAYAFSGKTGALLYRFANPDPSQAYEFFGQGVSNPGDVNGDGVDDPVIGASGYNDGAGVAYIESGKTGTVLRTLPSPAGGGFGLMVGDGIVPGDVNGDGVRDVYVGTPGLQVGDRSMGRGYLLSGSNGSILRTLDDPNSQDVDPQGSANFGYNHASAGDLNGDGTADVLAMRFVFGPGGAGGRAYVFDPRTGGVLLSLPGMRNDGPGSSVASPGDVNGDGYPDYFLGGDTIKVGSNDRQGQVIVELSQAPPGSAGSGLTASGTSTPSADTTAPIVSGYGLTSSVFAVGGQTPIFGTAASRRHRTGTTLKYTLSEAATVAITISQRTSGRRQGRRCVAPTPKRRRARRCTRLIPRGTLVRRSHPGTNLVAFSGRIGTRKLPVGRYRATLRATDAAGNTSAAKTVSFRIVRR